MTERAIPFPQPPIADIPAAISKNLDDLGTSAKKRVESLQKNRVQVAHFFLKFFRDMVRSQKKNELTSWYPTMANTITRSKLDSSSYRFKDPPKEDSRCENCNGSGKVSCSSCGGTGIALVAGKYTSCIFCRHGRTDCDKCSGTGKA